MWTNSNEKSKRFYPNITYPCLWLNTLAQSNLDKTGTRNELNLIKTAPEFQVYEVTNIKLLSCGLFFNLSAWLLSYSLKSFDNSESFYRSSSIYCRHNLLNANLISCGKKRGKHFDYKVKVVGSRFEFTPSAGVKSLLTYTLYFQNWTDYLYF